MTRNELPKYPKYKDSGVKWLGEIPAHWQVNDLKFLSENSKNSFVDGPFGSDLKNEEYVEMGIPLIQLNNIGIGQHVFNDMKFITEQKSEQLARHRVEPNDLVIAKMAEPVARAAKVRPEFPIYVIVADCVKHRPDANKVLADFLVLAMNTTYTRAQAEARAKGTTRIRIGLTELKRIKIAYPDITEQLSIVSRIDHETGKIDRLMDVRRKQIELLQEQHSAVIHHAVTKGIDPTVPMKDSGIEWLGEIPAHWKVRPLKRYLVGIKDGTHGTHERISDGVPLLSAKNVQDGRISIDDAESLINKKEHDLIVSNGYPKKGDVLITIVGSIGRTAVFYFDAPLAFQRSVAFLRFRKKVSPEYMSYFIRSETFQYQLTQKTKTSAQGGVYMGALIELYCTFPPNNEQEIIAAYLDRETEKIDTLIDKYKRELLLLEEYRASLISHAVTGKIDVRGLVDAAKEKEEAPA